MIKSLVLSFLLASTAQAASIVKSENNSLEIKPQKDDIEVHLPTTAFEVLKKWNSEFVLFNRADYSKSVLEMFKEMGDNQQPMAFIEDVDGNDKKDVVLLGNDSKKQYAVVLLQRDKKWTLIKITSWSLKNIKDTVIPATEVKAASGTTASAPEKEIGIPLYVLKALGEHAEKLKDKKKVGIQVENYLGSGEVFEIIDNKAVKFTLQ